MIDLDFNWAMFILLIILQIRIYLFKIMIYYLTQIIYECIDRLFYVCFNIQVYYFPTLLYFVF